MENINVNGVVDTLGDALKLAANLSEKKDFKPNDSSNNTYSTPNQTVQIQLASDSNKDKEPPKPSKPAKPVVIVKKDFPDNRALTPEECSLALEREKMANSFKIQEFEYRKLMDDINRRDRIAREEREREEREKREKKAEKWAKVRTIIGCIVGLAGATCVGYSIYKDAKTINAPGTTGSYTKPVSAEGSVK